MSQCASSYELLEFKLPAPASISIPGGLLAALYR